MTTTYESGEGVAGQGDGWGAAARTGPVGGRWSDGPSAAARQRRSGGAGSKWGRQWPSQRRTRQHWVRAADGGALDYKAAGSVRAGVRGGRCRWASGGRWAAPSSQSWTPRPSLLQLMTAPARCCRWAGVRNEGNRRRQLPSLRALGRAGVDAAVSSRWCPNSRLTALQSQPRPA